MQAQIKPHFLYNSLNVIATLIKLEPDKAKSLIVDLSSYLRHVFQYHQLVKYITLQEELDIVQSYVRIEQARFRNKLLVKYDIAEDMTFMLPPLILQPLVENAIRHGLRKKSGQGTVTIGVKVEEAHYVVEVQDDGAGMSEQLVEKIQLSKFQHDKGIGVANINLRLTELYGEKLMIHSEEGQGTTVSFRIPKKCK